MGRERREQPGLKAVCAELQQSSELFQRRQRKSAAVLFAAYSHVFRSKSELPGSIALLLSSIAFVLSTSAIALVFGAEPQLRRRWFAH